MLQFLGHSQVHHLRVFHRLFHVLDVTARNTLFIKDVDPIGRGFFFGALCNQFVERRAILAARLNIFKTWVFSNLGATQRLNQAHEHFCTHCSQVDKTIRSWIHACRSSGWVVIARLAWNLFVHQPTHNLKVHHPNLRLQQGRLYPLAFA